MLRRVLRKLRGVAARITRGHRKPGHVRPYANAIAGNAPGALAREGRDGGRPYKEYTVELPPGYPARRVTVRLSVPLLPARAGFAFTEHVMADDGASETVIAAGEGGFAISGDLGATWRTIPVAAYRRRKFHHVRALGAGEYLCQAEPLEARRDLPHAADTFVVNEVGAVLASSPGLSVPWHSARAVDVRGGVAMFAEYPPNPGHDNRLVSRVFRSSDRGRTWQIVFQRSGAEVRHFHFLQGRPGTAREWWLTSGDAPNESRIWVTQTDGNSWTDITAAGAKRIAVGEAKFLRDIFRLTDLAWIGDEFVWGTDDVLWDVKNAMPGARLFRSAVAAPFAPDPVARCKWHIRSLVDVGDFFVAISQGCAEPRAVDAAEARPGVYLMPKHAIAGAPGAVHLFDVDTYSRHRTGFTYASASRAAKDGTFFSFRAKTDAFNGGNQILRWDVRFD